MSNTSINNNLLINKSGNSDLTNNTLNKIKKIRKEKIKTDNNNNNNKNKNLNINLSNEEELLETKNNKKNKFLSKYPNEFNQNNNKNKINNLIIEDNNIITKNNNSNLNINQKSEKEIEMLKEINFLKKEIKLKDEIIKKLIEENKKLIEKIKIKEIDLLNSKNNEENLTKAIQENNKCISILNELILKYMPQNNNNKENINNNKIAKSKIDKIDNYLPNFIDIKKHEKKYDNNTTQFYSNIQLNNEINKLPNGNSVQRYFKLRTRNKIKKNISKNFNKQNNRSSFDDNKDKDKYNDLSMKEKNNCRNEMLKRNNTVGLDFINCNNKNNNSDLNIINGGLNYINNKLIKSSPNNNIIKKKTKKNYIRYNLDLLEEENNSDYNNEYFLGNISCKNVKIEKKMDGFIKKLDNNNNFSLKENFSFNNINNNHKIVSSNKINDIKEKKNEIGKNYNVKYIKKLNSTNIEKQNHLFRKLKNNKNVYSTDININYINEKSFFYKTKKPKYELITNNMITKERNKFFSPIIRGNKFI